MWTWKFKEVFLCLLWLRLFFNVLGMSLTNNNGEYYSLSNETMKNIIVKPYFDNISTNSTELKAVEGETIVIPCTVKELSRGKVVSWIRTRDLHILTSEIYSFSTDNRFEAVHTDGNTDFWGLRIKNVKIEDSGKYECQINTEPKRSLSFELLVLGHNVRETTKWLGYAKILSSRDILVERGSSLIINCEITPIILKSIVMKVWWLHDQNQIIPTKQSRQSIQTIYKEEVNILHSTLTFSYVTFDDSGMYSCLQPSVMSDEVNVTVIEAGVSEAMQSDHPTFSCSGKGYSCYINFFIIIILNRCI